METRPAYVNITAPNIPVAGRHCGECAMCCKLGSIKEVPKDDGKWCPHCSTQKHCDVYPLRPDVCKVFHCYFLLSELGEEWRPTTSKFIVSLMPGKLVYLSVDAEHPDAWRREPYFSTVLKWASQEYVRVAVLVGLHVYAVYPDRIDDLGIMNNGRALTYRDEPGTGGKLRRTIMVTPDLHVMPVEATHGVAEMLV